MRMKLYSRPGNDLTKRFPLIVEALARLRPSSCNLDGQAVCCDGQGPSIIDFGVAAAPPDPRCLALRIWCDHAVL
jgi:ATP-dependent DNA ligase